MDFNDKEIEGGDLQIDFLSCWLVLVGEMAEDFQARTSATVFDGLAAAVPPVVFSAPCSMDINHHMLSYGLSTATCEDQHPTIATPLTFQDGHKVTADNLFIDSTLPLATVFDLSSPTFDWNQALLLRNCGTTQQTGFIHAPMLQEELSSKPYFFQETPATLEPNNLQVQMGVVEDVNQAFMVDQHHHMSSDNTTVNNFPASYGSSSLYLQPLFEPDMKHQQSPTGYNHWSSNDMNQNQLPSWFRFPQFFKPSQLPSPLSHKQQQLGQLHFSNNNTAFWNPPATSSVDDGRSDGLIFPPVHKQFSPNCFDPKPNESIKSISDDVRNSSSQTKKGNDQPALKKPRVETPSPLPIFKVRKEKLSDRITALQQMVSPFGKTDTASVLSEAIEYIKYLHYEVGALSTPYLKNVHHKQTQTSEKSKEEEGQKRDLLSRGLCLVPIASTNIPISVDQSSSDLWTHNLGGSYR